MLELLNPALLGGLAAMSVPIIVHIAHRRRVTRIDWGAMRFLLEMLARRRRRLLIEQWLLLLVRMLAIACLAFALLRPAWRSVGGFGTGGPAASRIVRGGRTAAVILVDDSVSTAIRQRRTVRVRGATAGGVRAGPELPATALDSMKALTEAYIDGLREGDEMSVIRLSEIDEPPSDPLYDAHAARELVRAVEPTGVLSDVPALLEAGLRQLGRHLNPNAEIVLVTDGRGEGWRPDERGRWAEIRKRFRRPAFQPEGAGDESRGLPRLVILQPRADEEVENLAVVDLDIRRTLVPAGRPVDFRVELRHRGERPPQGTVIRFEVDGRTVDERPLEMEPGTASTLVFTHSFDEPGSHVVAAAAEGARDAFPADDRRCLSVKVSGSTPVLLVEGEVGEGLEGGLGFLAAALDPWHAPRDGDDAAGLFGVERIPSADLPRARLEDYGAVVLGDVQALDASSVAALERYIVSGGGVLVGLGPRTDPELVNRFWARRGDGFLPAPLAKNPGGPRDANGAVEPAKPAVPATANTGHPALAAFKGDAGEAWKAGRIRRYFRLDLEAVDPGEIATLVVLDSGDPLVVERRRGLGRVTLVTTSLDMSWTDLPVQPAYVPLVRGLVGHLGSAVLPPRNLRPGERLTHSAAASARGGAPSARRYANGPDGSPLELKAGTWEGRHVFLSEPLQQTGVYAVHDEGGAAEGPDGPDGAALGTSTGEREGEPGASGATYYAVTTHPDESRLDPVDEDERRLAVGGLEPPVLGTEDELRACLDPEGARPVEMWRWLLAASVALLFAETLITRRQASMEGRTDGAQAERAATSGYVPSAASADGRATRSSGRVARGDGGRQTATAGTGTGASGDG